MLSLVDNAKGEMEIIDLDLSVRYHKLLTTLFNMTSSGDRHTLRTDECRKRLFNRLYEENMSHGHKPKIIHVAGTKGKGR